MKTRFVVEHDWLTRTSRMIDTLGLEEVEFPFRPASSELADIAGRCEASPGLFADFIRRRISRPYAMGLR